MPAKGTKTPKKTPRSNTVKSSAKNLLSRKINFNWKIAVIIAIVVAVALGYLLVRLSSAGAGLRSYPANLWFTYNDNRGKPITKNDGTTAIESVTEGASERIKITINISGATASSTEYCMELATAGATTVSGGAVVNNVTRMGFSERIGGATNGRVKKCFWLSGRDAAASKQLFFTAESAAGQKSYFYGVTEKATYVVQQEKAAGVPSPSQAPAPTNTCSGVYGQGNQGPCVTLIQQRLKDLGYDPGPVDGIYGAKTTSATKVFQSRNGLTQDGVVGPQTWAALTSPNAVRKQ